MSGVAKQIKDKNPIANSMHCINHSLNMILQEIATKCPMVKGALSVDLLLTKKCIDHRAALMMVLSNMNGKPPRKKKPVI
eukprot:superscaffoldBa00000518_g5368